MEENSSYNKLAVQATLHCMTGCMLGEMIGMFLAQLIRLSLIESIAIAVFFAYLFGFALTSIPLVKASLPWKKVVKIALLSDTLSITVMELVDNGVILLFPGDPHGVLLFAVVLLGFAVAFPFAFLLNKHLLQKGQGHALVHEYHHH